MEQNDNIFWYEFIELNCILGVIPFTVGVVILIVYLIKQSKMSIKSKAIIVLLHVLLSLGLSMGLMLSSFLYDFLNNFIKEEGILLLLPGIFGEIISMIVTIIAVRSLQIKQRFLFWHFKY